MRNMGNIVQWIDVGDVVVFNGYFLGIQLKWIPIDGKAFEPSIA